MLDMKAAHITAGDTQVMRVSGGARVLLYAATALPLLMLGCYLPPQIFASGSGTVPEILCASVVALSVVWALLSVHCRCSVELSAAGISQRVLWARGQWLTRHSVSWTALDQAWFERVSYHLASRDGVEFQITVTLFADPEEVTALVDSWLQRAGRGRNASG